jgi:enoyl-CoA hydratase
MMNGMDFFFSFCFKVFFTGGSDMMKKILVETEESGVCWITINRPEIRNAIDYDVMDELKEVIELARQSDSIKVLVLTGTGDKAFCSGGDLSVFHRLRTKDEAFEMLSKMGSILYSLFTFPKPTVALINGTAVGGGCEIAAACDFRFAKAGTKMGFIQGNLAITTGWGGATMLFEKIPYDSALHMLWSGKIFTAEEAAQLGFIHKILDGNLKQSCRQMILPYINKSVNVLSAYKMALVRKWNDANLKERMFEEIERCSILWESEEHHQAVESFIKKKE